jgi:acid phosphatase (class A)
MEGGRDQSFAEEANMNHRRVSFRYAAGLVCCALGLGGAGLAQTPAGARPEAAPATSSPAHYLSAGQVDSVALLAPPPAPGSEAAELDLQQLLAVQRAAHAEGTIERAMADAQPSCARVADVLHLSAGSGAGVEFATRAALEASAATGAAKFYWHRARPYVVSTKVELPGDVATGKPPGSAAAKSWEYTSYPSGHSAFGTACAIVLAQMVPEERAALFARARAYGQSRVIIGAHFPVDVEAGRLIGTATAAFLLQNPQFQADLRAARAGLRQALGLPAEPPELKP